MVVKLSRIALTADKTSKLEDNFLNVTPLLEIPVE